MNEEEIKDKLTKICPCRQVTRATVKAAIREGAHTLEQIKAKTGAMTGGCRGRRCTASIQGLLDTYDAENDKWLSQ